jgi:hypothetical protein
MVWRAPRAGEPTGAVMEDVETGRARDEGQLTAPRAAAARALRAALAADAVTPGRAAWSPVIVLTYLHSGADRLRSLLSAAPGFACTEGTGVVRLCDQAVAVWRQAEGGISGPRTLSGQATAAVRAMAGGLAAKILGEASQQRWCEFLAVTQAPAAGTLLTLFPATRFICLHRCFGDVARAALRTSPWGLAGPCYSPFVAAQPGGALAAMAAYWVTHTAALLTFEHEHPQACLRVRYEDLAAAPELTSRTMLAFLGAGQAGGQRAPDPERQAAQRVPAEQVPEPLLSQVNDLLLRLGYPQLTPDDRM